MYFSKSEFFLAIRSFKLAGHSVIILGIIEKKRTRRGRSYQYRKKGNRKKKRFLMIYYHL